MIYIPIIWRVVYKRDLCVFLEITALVPLRNDILRYFCSMGKGEGKGKAAAHFDEGTLEVYKECFRLMDIDKDGVINKTDLR